MLIQAFAHTKKETIRAVNILYNSLKTEVMFFEFSVSEYTSPSDYCYLAPKESVGEVEDALDAHCDDSLDNIGVYYNDGQKIFIRVFKNAKQAKPA